jgi:hypothetical protein
MPDTYRIPDYWDFAAPGKSYRVDWVDAHRNIQCVARMRWTDELGGCTRTDTYYNPPLADTPPAFNGLGWHDSWYYVNDPVHGILEIADNGPKTTLFDRVFLFFVPYKHMVYSKEMEIPWGGDEEIGSVKTTRVKINPFRSAFLPPFPGFWSYAWQIVTYVAHLDSFTDCLGRTHSDVIRIEMAQPWDKADPKDLSCSGCTYWLAKGVGRVAVEWMQFDRDLHLVSTSAPQAAVYSGSIVLP